MNKRHTTVKGIAVLPVLLSLYLETLQKRINTFCWITLPIQLSYQSSHSRFCSAKCSYRCEHIIRWNKNKTPPLSLLEGHQFWTMKIVSRLREEDDSVCLKNLIRRKESNLKSFHRSRSEEMKSDMTRMKWRVNYSWYGIIYRVRYIFTWYKHAFIPEYRILWTIYGIK